MGKQGEIGKKGENLGKRRYCEKWRKLGKKGRNWGKTEEFGQKGGNWEKRYIIPPPPVLKGLNHADHMVRKSVKKKICICHKLVSESGADTKKLAPPVHPWQQLPVGRLNIR